MTSDQTLLSPTAEVRPRRLRLENIVHWDPLIAESGYSVKKLAAHCGYSVRTLQRFITNKFKRGLLDFIADVRLRNAHALLQTGVSVKEAAADLGYKQSSHFCRCFKERYGMTPSEFSRTAGQNEVGDHESGQLSLNVPLESPRKRMRQT
jgi:AraC-like DNA-binding protein